jgi:hypothetical protein
MQNARYSCQTLKKLEFFDRFSKNTQIPNFMKIISVQAELFRAGGRAGGLAGWRAGGQAGWRAGGWTDGRTDRKK